MKKWFIILFLVAAPFTLCGCFSLMKADKLVYAGSVGKKVDAAIIDSISRIETSSEK